MIELLLPASSAAEGRTAAAVLAAARPRASNGQHHAANGHLAPDAPADEHVRAGGPYCVARSGLSLRELSRVHLHMPWLIPPNGGHCTPAEN